MCIPTIHAILLRYKCLCFFFFACRPTREEEGKHLDHQNENTHISSPVGNIFPLLPAPTPPSTPPSITAVWIENRVAGKRGLQPRIYR